MLARSLQLRTGALHRRASAVTAGVLIVALAVLAIVLLERPSASNSSSAGRPPPPVTRSGSVLMVGGRVWRPVGVNMYWLGLDDNVSDAHGAVYPSHAAVDQGMQAAKDLGATLVRSTTLGVSVGSARSLEPTRGHFNDAAFAAIDYAVASARRHGLRLMIPLTDQWHYYHGGKHTFTNWRGHGDIAGQTVSTSTEQRAQEAYFYSDPKVVADFHAYVAHLLNHVNPLTGQRLGSDPTIAIWETGNELWDAPPSWTQSTAHYLKTLAPHALVADGSDSTGKNITETAVNAPDVDIIDAHFYPVDATTAKTQAAYTAAHHKAYLIGEYPLTGSPATTTAWLTGIAADHHISGDLAWTLLPYLPNGTPEPHGESYTIHYPAANPTEKTEDTELHQHATHMTT